MKWKFIIILVLVPLVVLGCAPKPSTPPSSAPSVATPAAPSVTPVLPPTEMSRPAPTPAATPIPAPTSTPKATPSPPPDTTPPPATTGLVATNAYDGKVNLWWDKSTASDFDHYSIYLNKAEIKDVSAMKPAQQIKDIATSRYQTTGLDNGTKYYFAVTAVDKSGNEDKRTASVNATPAPMPRGTKDPDLAADVYATDRMWAGTTLLPDNHYQDKSRIIEVNMLGEIIWEYSVPPALKRYTNPGFDVELLPNGNILYVLPGNGVYEMDRSGKTVWSYLTAKISHDADRLPNGNTIFAFGNYDQKSDAQVVEVNPKGEVVWTWYAKDYFNKPLYDSISNEGWTHTNAVSRLSNGNTLISLRNFNFIAEVDQQGAVVRTIGEGILLEQHDPEILPNGNILATSLPRGRPHSAVEIDPKTGKIVWEYLIPDRINWPVRDANRLPNGNTLITGTTEIVEVTPGGGIVWRLRLQGVSFSLQEAGGLGFYKADRISAQK